MTHRVAYTRTARRVISEHLPLAVAAACLEFIATALAENPHRAEKSLRAPLEGLHSARRGEFRVIYRIDDEEVLVLVVTIQHRRDVYRTWRPFAPRECPRGPASVGSRGASRGHRGQQADQRRPAAVAPSGSVTSASYSGTRAPSACSPHRGYPQVDREAMASARAIGFSGDMPKSRKRRRPHATRRSPHDPASSRRAQLEDLETVRPWLETMFAVDDAERRGDADEALRLISGRLLGPDGRAFWRPWRVSRLAQVTLLGPALPAWAVSRWIVAQAHETFGGAGDRRRRRSLELALEVRGSTDGLSVHGEDDAMCKMIDHDWVYRQLFLYELGGLSAFIRSAATPDLLAGADRIREWAKAPMVALRLEERTAESVTWERVDDREPLVLPNIGSAALVVPGEHVLGRLVPVEAGAMLESAPLVVPAEIADRVAEDPTSWIDAIAAARDRVPTGGFESGLLHDVRDTIWQLALTNPADAPPDESEIGVYLARATVELARQCLAEPFVWAPDDIDPWACVRAALLSLSVVTRLPQVAGPGDAILFERLAHRLAQPADIVCRDVARQLRMAA